VQYDPSGLLCVDVVDTRAALDHLRLDWLRLEVASALDLPFQTWEWTAAWWTHLRADHPGVRDHLRVLTVRTPSHALVGIAPLVLTERPASGPLRARYLQLIGPDPNITEIRTGLYAPLFEQACQRALSAYLSQRSSEWDWLMWEDRDATPDDDTSRHGLSKGHSAYVLTLPTTWQEMRASLHRNLKESLRKCYNSLKRDGLSYRLEVVDKPGSFSLALDDFYRLHSARARLEGVPPHSDMFETPHARAFLHDICQRLAQRGACRVFRLWIDDRVVATRIGFELSGVQYLYYSGWDPAYARYSVMTTLVAEIVRDSIRRGLRAVHLSTGSDVSKTRWGPRCYRYTTRVEVAPRASAHLLHFAYRAASRARTIDLARALVPGGLLRQPSGIVAVTRG